MSADTTRYINLAQPITFEAIRYHSHFIPIRPGLFLGAWARGAGKVPAVHNFKTIYGIEMKFGRVVENHKLVNLV